MQSNEILKRLADAASERPFYLGSILDGYARRDELDPATLAKKLTCDEATLDRLRVCRAPVVGHDEFPLDVRRIAHRFNVDLSVLLQIITDMSVSDVLGRANVAENKAGWLMAARDRDENLRGHDDR